MRIAFALLFVPLTAFATADNPTREELLQTVRHINQLSQQLQGDLKKEREAHNEVAMGLDAATKENNVLQSQINSLTDRANKAIRDHDKVMKKYHFLKWIASVIAAAVAVLIVMQFGAFIPAPFNLYAMIAAGGGATTLVWIFL